MIRSLLAFFALSSALLMAQDKGNISLRFVAERAPAVIGKVMIVAGEDKSTPFLLPTNNLSEVYPVAARAFTLNMVEQNRELCKITLPEEGKDFVILLLPNPKGGYLSSVIPAKSDGFRPGDVYFYNHADKTVLGFVGKATFVLPPGQGKSLRPTGAKAEGYYDVGFGVRETSGDRPLSSTRWPVEKQIRSYVFFFVNPQTKAVDFRAVDEYVVEEKAP